MYEVAIKPPSQYAAYPFVYVRLWNVRKIMDLFVKEIKLGKKDRMDLQLNSSRKTQTLHPSNQKPGSVTAGEGEIPCTYFFLKSI